jgi:hypothetical protein
LKMQIIHRKTKEMSCKEPRWSKAPGTKRVCELLFGGSLIPVCVF